MSDSVINDVVFSQLLIDVGEEMLPMLVDVFAEETTERIRDLKEMCVDTDYEKVAHSCHSIKSSAGTYGAHFVQKQAEELEVIAKEKNTSEIEIKLPLLIESLQAAVDELSAKCD